MSDIPADVDAELRFHLEERIQALQEDGRSLEEARDQALVEFGDVEAVRLGLVNIDRRIDRARRRSGWLSSLTQDVRYAVRSLTHARGFTVAAIATLALGVGVNSVMFGAIDAVLLRPLAYADPAQLVAYWEDAGPAGRYAGGTVSAANLVEAQSRTTSFSGIAAFRLAPRNLTGRGAPERIWVEQTTANYFTVLGVEPAIGRGFHADEGTPGRERVAVLSHALWRRLGADSSILGSTIRLDDVEYEIVGVLHPGARAPNELDRRDGAAVYVPIAFTPDQLGPRGHGSHDLDAVARLKRGASRAEAQADLDRVYASLAKAFPDSNATYTARISPLREDIVRNVRTLLLVLLGAVALVWLVACVNLANLLLVRASGRQREVTVRVALGASRWRIVQMLVTQSVVLALAGCGAGLVLGSQLGTLLQRLAPPGIPRLDSIEIDWRVFGAMTILSVGAGLLFGLFPAWQVSRAAVSDSLRASERHLAAPSVVRWRSALVVAEIAMSVILLTGSGLLLRSFVKLSGVDLGFTTDRVLTLNINLPRTRYPEAADRLRFFEAVTERVRSLPGVEAAGFANRFPMRGSWRGGVMAGPNKESVLVDLQVVSPEYFSTLGIPVIQGRSFTPADRMGAQLVAVVNRAFVRAYLNDREVVGHQLRRYEQAPPVTIVGVVADIRRSGKEGQLVPGVYYPAAQAELYPVVLADFALRTSEDPRALLPALREAVSAVDKDQPIGNVRTLREVVDDSVASRRFEMLLILLFAAVALVLTLVGVYGVVSYAVAQRTREFGLRTALGARASDILRMVLTQAAVLIAIGLAAGLCGAFALSRYLGTLLFEVAPHDLATFSAVTLLLSIVALLASFVPARRAAISDPVRALRAE